MSFIQHRLHAEIEMVENWDFATVAHLCIFFQLKHARGRPRLTHSQMLEGFRCESQIKNNGKVRSRGTLPNSQHFSGVEVRARTLGWN